jgi:nucleotide-binding universal stress UspA family protein
MKIQKMLVPVDGHELTAQAIDASLSLAQQLQASVVGYVAELDPVLPTSPRGRQLFEDAVLASEARASDHAHSVLAPFEAAARKAGVPFEGVFDSAPRIDEAIVTAAESHGCDLIVMVTHGRGAFGEFLFGSQTKAVLSRSQLPLLVLHPRPVT